MDRVENRRILVVDDEINIRQGYREALSPKPAQTFLSSHTLETVPVTPPLPTFEIYEAETGDQALEILKSEFAAGRRFAGAIVDVRMPGKLDGLQFIQAAWKLDPDLLVVVATAYQDRSVNEIDRLFGEEFQDHWDYLNKPFTSGEIIQKARQLVSSWNRRGREKSYVSKIQAQQTTLVDQERLAAIGRLARSVGHEFGNVLQPVLTQLEVAKERIQAGESEAVSDMIDQMIEAVQLGARITQDLLVFSRETHETLSANEKAQPLPTIDISDPIEKSLRLLNHELKRKDIQVNLSVQGLNSVRGQEARLVQVFVNLFINAIHAMKDGGSLTIQARTEDSYSVIRVKDNGTGISGENLGKIFEPLFTTKGASGNGLGLTVCKQIIEEYRGSLQISSQIDVGTEITIRLPTGKREKP